LDIKNELDGYHGRVTFDDRNIEDILSILSFNIIGGKKPHKDKLDSMLKAISRTIELTCNVKHDYSLNKIQRDGPEVYRRFWRNLFFWSKSHGSIPTIITFNYDLVLERSLFQVMMNTNYHEYDRFPFNGINIKYYCDTIDEFSYKVKYTRYRGPDPQEVKSGSYLEPVEGHSSHNFANIEILKLHGSLNFPKKKNTAQMTPTNVVKDPYILPPIFDKLSTKGDKKMWKIALLRLREAKNVVIVGYSLPRTDIYMQYFLKTALGPNINLNKIFVFDPVLFKKDETASDMEDRFACCFSPQLKNRIIFRPYFYTLRESNDGTFEHFVKTILEDKELFF